MTNALLLSIVRERSDKFNADNKIKQKRLNMDDKGKNVEKTGEASEENEFIKKKTVPKQKNGVASISIELPETILQTESLVLSSADVATLLGVSPITLHRWRNPAKGKEPQGPPWTMINGKVFYHKAGFSKWFDSQFNMAEIKS